MHPAASCISRFRRNPPASGVSTIFREGPDQRGFNVRMDFELRQLARGQQVDVTTDKETLWVLLSGRADVVLASVKHALVRRDVFEGGPSVVHCGQGDRFLVTARARCEWVVIRSTNPRRLPARLYRHDEFTSEDRGAGLAQGACRRCVRTIFDHSTRPDSVFVLGEVINFPGRWSTYPPHSHPQPEIYHYRFTKPQGYGHSEVGEDVYKVYHGDTVKIPGGLDHAQVSAPGYGMYYLWVIRHLPGRPYKGFTFNRQHRWLLDPRQQGWLPPVAPASA